MNHFKERNWHEGIVIELSSSEAKAWLNEMDCNKEKRSGYWQSKIYKVVSHHFHTRKKEEDKQDVKDAKKILKNVKAGKEKLVTKEKFEKETGLKVK